MSEREDDLPKTMAVIISSVPSLALRTGWVFLKTKRRVRKGSRYVLKGMMESGMPEELARQLAYQYEEDLSVRNLMHGLTGSSSPLKSWIDR